MIEEYSIDYQGAVYIKIITASGNELVFCKAEKGPNAFLVTGGSKMTRVQIRKLSELFDTQFVSGPFDVSDGAIKQQAISFRRLEAMAAGFEKEVPVDTIEAMRLEDYIAKYGTLYGPLSLTIADVHDKGLFLQVYVSNPQDPMILGRHAFSNDYFVLSKWTNTEPLEYIKRLSFKVDSQPAIEKLQGVGVETAMTPEMMIVPEEPQGKKVSLNFFEKIYIKKQYHDLWIDLKTKKKMKAIQPQAL